MCVQRLVKNLHFTAIGKQIKIKHCFKIQLIAVLFSYYINLCRKCFHILKYSVEKQGSKDRIPTCIIMVSLTLKSTWICCEKSTYLRKNHCFFLTLPEITFCYKVKFKIFFNKSKQQRLFLENMRFNTA